MLRIESKSTGKRYDEGYRFIISIYIYKHMCILVVYIICIMGVIAYFFIIFEHSKHFENMQCLNLLQTQNTHGSTLNKIN